MTARTTTLTLISLSLIIGAYGCSDDKGINSGAGGESAQSATYDYADILNNEVYGVILPTYEELMNGANDLHTAAMAFEADPTEAKLSATRKAWKAARVPWEQSEAFLFGPVAHLGLDPALDTWPIDRVQLDDVIDSNLELTAAAISENLGGGLKGFHTIEYLLWGEDGAGQPITAAALSTNARALEFLVATTDALKSDATTLHDAWSDEGEEGGFAKEFAQSGRDGGLYYAQADAVQQLVNGMVDICDEVANGKIADPFDEQSTELVESQFSHNSITDFSNNLRSVKIVYLGIRSEAKTLADAVKERDPDLHVKLVEQIEEAIDSIGMIPVDSDQPFREAILDPKRADEIEAAQKKIRTLMTTLQGELMSLLLG